MKGTLLALLSFFLFAIASLFFLRSYRGKKYFYIFLAESPFVCLSYACLFYYLPENLFFLPPGLSEPCRLVDFCNGFLILLLLIHIFWDALYGMILTGFSTELIVQLFLQKERGLSVKELSEAFGEAQEMDVVLAWRLPNLLRNGYLSPEGDRFYLTKKGRSLAIFAAFLKRLFTMDVEG